MGGDSNNHPFDFGLLKEFDPLPILAEWGVPDWQNLRPLSSKSQSDLMQRGASILYTFGSLGVYVTALHQTSIGCTNPASDSRDSLESIAWVAITP